MTKPRPYNFSAGPAAIPLEVLEQAAAELQAAGIDARWIAADCGKEEDIRRLTGTVLLINDANGVQYMIRDLAAMDKHSRKLLDRFL